MSEKIHPTILETLRTKYNLEKLCPQCEGLLEKENQIKCKMCSTVEHVLSASNMAQTAIMRLQQSVRKNKGEKN